jgi:hypothetical protein
MTLYDNKREYERHDLYTPIVYAYQDSDQFFRARMCNYCKEGMSFESVSAIEPGADIYIMLESFLPEAGDADFYDGYLAEVRWCRKFPKQNEERYKVGVKYYQTIIQ